MGYCCFTRGRKLGLLGDDFSQKYGSGYDEVSAPVVSQVTQKLKHTLNTVILKQRLQKQIHKHETL